MKYFLLLFIVFYSITGYASEFDAELLRLTNAERTANGLPNLTLNNDLGQAAQAHAEDMANNGSLSHTGSNGSSVGDRIAATNYQDMMTWGENVAAGQTSPESVIAGWMNSPGHRANILNADFKEIGFGYANNQNDTYKHYWVQVFGTSRSSNTTTTTTPSTTPTTTANTTPTTVGQFDAELLRLTNAERTANGLPNLILNNDLGQAAQAHAEDMANNGFLSHTGSNGSSVGDRIAATNYQDMMWGENIAAGQTSPESVIAGWMDSPGHRANILNADFKEIGFGYANNQNDTYKHYWVQVFGTSRSGNTTTTTTPSADTQTPTTTANTTPTTVGQFDAELLRLTNAERTANGLPNLTLNNDLGQAAQAHAEDMANNGFLSHTGSNGSSVGDRIAATNYQDMMWGENIAAGQTSPESVIAGWMDSPGHRANILNADFKEIGFGYANNQNDTYKHYWVQVFGTSRSGNTTPPIEPTVPDTPPITTANCANDTCNYSLDFSSSGFYVARVSLPSNQPEGQWGLSISNSSGLSDGGFSCGSVLRENGEAPGFSSFYLTEATSVNLEVYEYTGQINQLTVEIRRDNVDTVYGPAVHTIGSPTAIPELPAGYYVAAVTSPSGAPRSYFGLGIYGNNIRSSVDIGGMIDPTSGLGFIGFPVTQPMTVNFTLFFGQNYSTIGAGQPNLQILRNETDGSTTEIWSSPE